MEDLKEIIEIVKTNNGLDEFIANMTYEDFRKLLISINCFVRGISKEQGGIYDGYMLVSDLISPSNDIQEICLDRLLDVLKALKERKERGTLLYYMVNDLHLFKDGNGRTSRFLFELITNNDFNLDNSNPIYSHTSGEFSKLKFTDFEKSRGIISTSLINNWVSYFLLEELHITDVIEKCEGLRGKSISTWRKWCSC